MPPRGTWLALLCAACAATPPLGGGLPAGWQRTRAGGAGVVYHHADGGTIASERTCDDADDVPLDVLTNHALIGVAQRRERSRTPLLLDGRAALRTRLDGQLDGVSVVLDLVVLKKDGCTYDLFLVAPPASFDRCRVDFDGVLARFAGAGGP